jgi:hypothetical protein
MIGSYGEFSRSSLPDPGRGRLHIHGIVEIDVCEEGGDAIFGARGLEHDIVGARRHAEPGWDGKSGPQEMRARKSKKCNRKTCSSRHAHFISTGVLEAINGLVQAAKARARGYRNAKNLIAMVYLIAGKQSFEDLPVLALCAAHSK